MLEEVKSYLAITWADDDIDAKLVRMIDESKAAIASLMGGEVDFENNREMRELLKNRVRYAYNNSLEYFAENFAETILRLQLLAGVEKIEK